MDMPCQCQNGVLAMEVKGGDCISDGNQWIVKIEKPLPRDNIIEDIYWIQIRYGVHEASPEFILSYKCVYT